MAVDTSLQVTPRVAKLNEDQFTVTTKRDRGSTTSDPASAAIFSHRYDSFKITRIQTFGTYCSIRSKACQTLSSQSIYLLIAAILDQRTSNLDIITVGL
ncbi:hypothetical protein TNCV_1143711 [Trichonephila clavipes]|nr:hypothetical protein TNCV_1143711 [Trichonephila clavipes]